MSRANKPAQHFINMATSSESSGDLIPVIPLDNNFDVISFVLGTDESLEDGLTDIIEV